MTSPPAGRNAFGDPATGELYVWQRNHEEEQAAGRVRRIDWSAPTGARWRAGVTPVRVQGARDELVYRLAGKCPTLAQHQAFLRFMDLSLRQTIYFFHCAGQTYECQLSDYQPARAFALGLGDKWRWAYTMQLEVIQVL